MAGTFVSRFLHGTLLMKAKSITSFMFNKHLLLTNLGLSMCLSSTGDFLEQRYEILKSSDRTYNSRRTLNMGITGCTIGFICHHWYNWLDKFLPGRTWRIVGKKVIIDQLVCSPMIIGAFFVTLSLLERHSAQEFMAEFKEKSWRLYLAEWVVWPFAQVINFSILPTKYRVLYDNTISLGYDVYTSYVYNEIPTPSQVETTKSNIDGCQSSDNTPNPLASE